MTVSVTVLDVCAPACSTPARPDRSKSKSESESESESKNASFNDYIHTIRTDTQTLTRERPPARPSLTERILYPQTELHAHIDIPRCHPTSAPLVHNMTRNGRDVPVFTILENCTAFSAALCRSSMEKILRPESLICDSVGR